MKDLSTGYLGPNNVAVLEPNTEVGWAQTTELRYRPAARKICASGLCSAEVWSRYLDIYRGSKPARNKQKGGGANNRQTQFYRQSAFLRINGYFIRWPPLLMRYQCAPCSYVHSPATSPLFRIENNLEQIGKNTQYDFPVRPLNIRV